MGQEIDGIEFKHGFIFYSFKHKSYFELNKNE